MPTPASSSCPRPTSFNISRPFSHTHAMTFSGPRAMSSSACRNANGWASRSVIATRAWLAPTSAARITRAAALNSKRAAGRPPVEVALLPSRISPASCNDSSRAPTVDRPSPVAVISSALVRIPWRRIRSSSAALPTALAVGVWSGTGTVKHRRLLNDKTKSVF